MIFYDSTDEKIKGVEQYWRDNMPMMAMEECGELIQAISKLERWKRSVKESNIKAASIDELLDMYKNDVIAEMRDIHIAMAALQVRYGIPDEAVIDAIEKKLDRRYDKS